MPDVCAVCEREGTVAHPLVTSDSEEKLCHGHSIDFDGAILSPSEFETDLDTRIDTVKTWARDRHNTPPDVTTFPEAKSELVATWVQVDELMCLVLGLHENQKRIKIGAGVK